MKTSSRHSPTNAVSRHLRESRLFRRLLKAQRSKFAGATYDVPAANLDLSYTAKKKEDAERLVPDIQITPPPPYETLLSTPAVHDVPRFQPVIHEPKPNQQTAYSVASLNTPAPTNTLTRPLDDFSTPSLEPSSFEDMDPSSAPAFLPHTTPLRHHRSAENLRQSNPIFLTRPSPLGSHPVEEELTTDHSLTKEQTLPATRYRRPTQPPLLRRASSYPLIPVAIMSPIREEDPPRSPLRPRAATVPADAHSAIIKRQSHRPPIISILRHTPTTSTTTSAPHRQREQKHVHFEPSVIPEEEEEEVVDAPAPPLLRKEQLLMFSAAVMAVSLLLVLAFADVFDSARACAQVVRLEYVVAFIVGCGVAHWLSGVAEMVGGTLGRAREEGWV
ncbi:hypothetical protein BFW01_g10620 [Lasiodiplodia theobromae]|uniref:Uncharacterized protein n=1 Tax=Lasiodiplodia theobromae TaxID=45133 RepID=A0A8H7IQF1_9PEZI|nr:hypothetical protein BFW01_g10620 [Lasiodiplodia theobromae]